MQPGVSQKRYSYPKSPLAIAFGFSILLHLLLFTLIEILPKDHWIRKLPVAEKWLDPALLLQQLRAHEQNPPKTETKSQEYPLILVQLPRDQVSEEPPPQAKYYSDKSTKAANPEPPTKATDQPKLDGQQDKVIRLSQPTAPPSQPPPPPSPPPTQNSIQQSAPPPQTASSQVQEQVTQERSNPTQPTQPKDLQNILVPPQLKTAGNEPKTITIAKQDALLPKTPEPKPRQPPVRDQSPAPTKPTQKQTPSASKQPRPRTLAQAYQQNPQLRGERMRQDGGVKRRAVTASLDVRASPFGAYDQAVVQAIEERWFQLLDENSYAGERVGKVVLEFKFKHDGTVSEMRVAETSVGEVLALLCMRAVKDPSPFEKWPSDMRLLYSTGFREVKFTFYYN